MGMGKKPENKGRYTLSDHFQSRRRTQPGYCVVLISLTDFGSRSSGYMKIPPRPNSFVTESTGAFHLRSDGGPAKRMRVHPLQKPQDPHGARPGHIDPQNTK